MRLTAATTQLVSSRLPTKQNLVRALQRVLLGECRADLITSLCIRSGVRLSELGEVEVITAESQVLLAWLCKQRRFLHFAIALHLKPGWSVSTTHRANIDSSSGGESVVVEDPMPPELEGSETMPMRTCGAWVYCSKSCYSEIALSNR